MYCIHEKVSVGRYRRRLTKVLGTSMVLGVYEFSVSVGTSWRVCFSVGRYRHPKRREFMTWKLDVTETYIYVLGDYSFSWFTWITFFIPWIGKVWTHKFLVDMYVSILWTSRHRNGSRSLNEEYGPVKELRGKGDRECPWPLLDRKERGISFVFGVCEFSLI